MRIKKCIGCGRPAFPISPSVPGSSKWVCPACDKKINEINFKEITEKPDYCRKCKKRTTGTCPFSARERRRIVKCNHWIGRHSEHDKKRFAKFEDCED
jgi:hypothetical protein